MITKAYEIIFEAFKNKSDKAGMPYIFHLQRVADNFKENEYLYVIALLHDLLEDCENWDIEMLREYFPEDICWAVKCLTKEKGETYDNYLYRVESNNFSIRVKLADLKDNMDLSRIKHKLTQKDLDRIVKYHDAYLRLTNFIK